VGLILALIKEYGKKEKWLDLSMTIGSMGELVSIVLLSIVSASLQFGFDSKLLEVFILLGLFFVAIVLFYKGLRLIFWWFPELKIKLMPHYDKDEKDIRISMATFFIMIFIMLLLDLEVAFGAFIAGILIATFFDHKKELPHKLSSFGFGFLVPIFFVYIGFTFDLNSIFSEGLLLKTALITVIMIVVRLISSVTLLGILKPKELILFGLSHSMPLTLLIAVASTAYISGNLDQILYYAFILAALIQVIISMVAIKLIKNYKPKETLEYET
jgi:Kef-type K+ transport system membrane component KefB